MYISFEGKLSVVYGQGNYKYNEAVLAQPPSSIPDYLNTFAILAGKIVIQKNASSFSTIESAFVKVFVPEDTFDHNDLASLQGGTSGEYYHLTSAEHSELTDWLDNVTLLPDGNLILPNIKSGATQAAAGAAAGEIWKTSGHSSLPDNVLMVGI